ncbi:MAG: tRNA preQ1(34) S-adenosylmethionine ribosyltransferase-isomerase QueA [Chloroflexi bacterium]|nr:tRNA preQ1(34) S-adenosylmethionine ribosyltransferase-isomerase QueA [Chloroflexota bacterium]MCI0576500.1 tRNA preQ1(34) S-adenosylmethionine ribosyltransferase-isomerase QueA [Chloroflexota bacterium]MCI0650222.1 tRNA preQ1(34) S-adenosylmethionine ribosyltransferase-isomerase QueA [Chloroflexota bacterium]MCI0729400.1 tRNA preQ1(34) S-adenosylmethionine ribosyltransferase-isomerase QueA [Chloroflexota bacterium]
MKTADFDYHLPPQLIAQRPLDRRDASRLLVLYRESGRLEHRTFADLIEYLRPGDIVVANDSRVIPARLYGRKLETGGKVELLLLEQLDATRWRALAGGRRLLEGTQIRLDDRGDRPTGLVATVTAVLEGPQREIVFNHPLAGRLDELGHTPLPPYIHEELDDPNRYQTIYARPPGSAAAPTAGLHFTANLLLSLRENGVLFETVTLHVGLDTFKPVETAEVADHTIHSEWARLAPEAAQRINQAKLAGGRIVAVGTTTVRVLETAALRSAGLTGSLATISQRDAAGETANICPWQPVAAVEGRCDLFIYPGYRFRAVDVLITNFHLPQSSLLMLVSAFAGREQILAAYQAAVEEKYRFYSFGDAMLIL